VRSARPRHPLGVLLVAFIACLFLGGSLSGCTTTQDTAAKKQAQSKRILEARERRTQSNRKRDQNR
jgi:formate/nitrite transporter FocA (FNT family)